MRWRYTDPANPTEVALRNEIIEKIDAWWEEFALRTQDLQNLFKGQARWDLPGWMHRHLNAVHSHLMWEFGPARQGTGHRLVITPESQTDIRPLLQTILDRAPQLPGWEFYPYRPSENFDASQEMVRSRVHGDLTGMFFTATIGQHHRIDLLFHFPSATCEHQQAIKNAFVATETLLGEELLDKWIGIIDAQPLLEAKGFAKLFGRSPKPSNLLPLSRLKPTADAVIASILDQLSTHPRCQEGVRTVNPDDRAGFLFQLKPQPANDYIEKHDLLVANGSDENLFRALHSKTSSFYSDRYSRCAETFCFIKIDGALHPPIANVEDRGKIEDAIDALLIPHGLGCTIGGGTGLRYAYIDLALTNVDASIPMIRTALQRVDVSPRSWIQFFDRHLTHEWIGIYENTPPPPRPLDTPQGT